MNKIRFCHIYSKLLLKDGSVIKQAKLIGAEEVELSNLSYEFRKYDTDGFKFPLPKEGKYIRLMFLKEYGNIFTTLRPWTPSKMEYYKQLVGKDFEVEATEE